MCGIVGKYNLKEAIHRENFNKMRDTLAHRGPNGADSFFSISSHIALGHRRLAIIDLSSTGTQPMHNEDNTLWLTANGEIYNYKNLKLELEKAGHKFYSNSDSEVILHGYEQWGENILNKLKGMFAFAIWDSNKEELFLARDRFGIKPLYYYFNNNTFVFGSELKSIVTDKDFIKTPNISSFSDFLVYRYVPSPKTIWENTFKIPPAHFVTFNWKQGLKIEEYWKLNIDNKIISIEEATEKINILLSNSVNEHINSDVQIGSFLSGGYDSSTLTYYLNKIDYPTKTFSIGFENWDKSEHKYAEIVSNIFNTEHKSKILSNDIINNIDEIIDCYDEPIADISIQPTFEVSKLASKTVRTAISGEGADEIFAGYTWHSDLMKRNQYYNSDILRKNIKGHKFTGVEGYSNAMAMGLFNKNILQNIISPDLINYIPNEPFWFYYQHYNKEIDPLKAFQYLDLKTFMSELVLTKVDRASMANSLEVRLPFLDHELVEYLFSLDKSVYYKNSKQKNLLYLLIKDVLPKEILNRKKQGFVGPDSFYMQIDFYKSALKSSRLVKNGIIQNNYLKILFNNFDYWRLWKITVLEKWYNKWL
jgi:asparagine synthase (glutamine-hydrolysing)